MLATKVYGRMGEKPNEGRLSALHIRRACEESLRRLRTDHIDLYQMHHVDRDCPWEEIWQAMEILIRQGKVLGRVSEQSLYNLTQRAIELEVLPAARAYGLGILPWSPLAGGLLGGVLQGRGQGRRASENLARRIASLRPRLERHEGLCREIGHAPAQVALAWLLHRPGVTAPIIGPRTMEQLEECLGALAIRLDEDRLRALDEIWPGPGGEAPEAYAW